jgi:hypothetical protein
MPRPAQHRLAGSASAKTRLAPLPPSSSATFFSPVGGGLGNRDAGAGRAGKADHVHIGMHGKLGADARTVAVHHVEDARRQPGLVHDLGEDHRGQRRDLGRFQHHRYRRASIAGITFSVTWFIGQFHGVISPTTPIGSHEIMVVGAMRPSGRMNSKLRKASMKVCDVIGADPDLIGQRHVLRGAHFMGDRPGHVGRPALIDRQDLFDIGQPFRRGRRRPCREGPLGRGHRRIGIRLIAQRDHRHRLLGRGVDHLKVIGGGRIDPFAVDVEFALVQPVSLIRTSPLTEWSHLAPGRGRNPARVYHD